MWDSDWEWEYGFNSDVMWIEGSDRSVNHSIWIFARISLTLRLRYQWSTRIRTGGWFIHRNLSWLHTRKSSCNKVKILGNLKVYPLLISHLHASIKRLDFRISSKHAIFLYQTRISHPKRLVESGPYRSKNIIRTQSYRWDNTVKFRKWTETA